MTAAEQLAADAAAINTLRRDILFDRDVYVENVAGAASFHVLQALAQLELARTSFLLALGETK